MTAADDKLRPCQISKMPSDRLREKAVLTAVEAFQRSDDYTQRGNRIKNKFDADEDGKWSVFLRHEDVGIDKA